MSTIHLGRSAPPLDLPVFIDAQPVGTHQIRLVMICAAVLFLDGFDTQAIGYVAPDIARAWGLSRGALGPVFSAGLFGLMLGALVFGPLADRIGRRRIILASVFGFGALTLATLFAPDVQTLLLLRFLTGFGLGGAMPNTIALTTEFSPLRRRATMVMTMFCGFSVGAAVGGLIAAALVPQYGWQSVFAVGGLAPLLMLPLLVRTLPESIRFRVMHNADPAAVTATLRRFFPKVALAEDARFFVTETRPDGLPVLHLFREGRALVTVLLWCVFFMSLLDLYFMANWLPSVLHELGASVSVSAALGALLQVGGIVGTFSLGQVIDRFSFKALALTYLVAALAIAAVGQSGHSMPLAAVTIFAAGFCVVGGQIAVNALAATYYPTAIRATGIGWSLGIGRAGSIIGPLIGGVLLAMRWSTDSLFLMAAIPALIAAVAALILNRATAASRG